MKGRPVVVLARQITPGNFAFGAMSTLGGCSVQPHAEIPRALDAAGRPRFDVFAFTLADGNDRRKFSPGQRVHLILRDP